MDIINSTKEDIMVKREHSDSVILAKINYSENYDFFIQFGFKGKGKGKDIFFIDSFLKNSLVLTPIEDEHIIQLLQIIRIDTSNNNNYKTNNYLNELESDDWFKVIDGAFVYFFKFLELKPSVKKLRLLPYKEKDFTTEMINFTRHDGNHFLISTNYLLSIDFTKSFPLIENNQKFHLKNIIFPLILSKEIKKLLHKI